MNLAAHSTPPAGGDQVLAIAVSARGKLAIGEAEIGHRSASLCHLGVIALRLGCELKWDRAAESILGDDEAK